MQSFAIDQGGQVWRWGTFDGTTTPTPELVTTACSGSGGTITGSSSFYGAFLLCPDGSAWGLPVTGSSLRSLTLPPGGIVALQTGAGWPQAIDAQHQAWQLTAIGLETEPNLNGVTAMGNSLYTGNLVATSG